MSRTLKDALIMAGAAGSVGLLVVGAEIGVPAIAGAAAAVAIGSALAKIATSHMDAVKDETARATHARPHRVAALR